MDKIDYTTQILSLLLIIILGYWIFIGVSAMFSIDIPSIFFEIGPILIIPFIITFLIWVFKQS